MFQLERRFLPLALTPDAAAGAAGHHATLDGPTANVGTARWGCLSHREIPVPPRAVAMEVTSVLSPSSWEKRRAWARQSRCWRTTVVEEEAAAAMQDVPELQPPHLDDVFLEASPSSKIETWLQECGSSLEVPLEELGLLGPLGGSNRTSFEDDLTLGAEALLLPASDKAKGRALRDKHLNLGHSMASSALSSLTTKTSSSISDVLEWWQADAEEILYNLGFVQSEAGAVSRVPARFFSAPSRAKGIDFQVFLKAQVRRMETEDPCLMLASRFQQVQALAATADAFFCLYSYVSRTPVQRISPTCLTWAFPDIPDLLIAPTQPCTLSPVERLKKVVSTMCLYASPRDEDGPRGTMWVTTVPTTQPKTLDKVVQEVLSTSEDDDGCDSREEAARCLHLSAGVRRNLLLHASSGQSDSSGFVEEPVPGQPPNGHLHGTDQMT
ncbi:protein TESPA1 [Cuculus canorus]|uniref:protein TESPA1 n=1 Tax=Cuculus canorus TaxID=55661 RepID=UPI0023AAE756|nr:protein TESPA1 [Cuculus canorus]